MWIFTTRGFFSVVCAADVDGVGLGIDPETMMIRARVRGHLESLVNDFRLDVPIVETSNRDYRFRIIVSKAVWQAMAERLAEDVEYGNFKNVVKERFGNDAYESALHSVWNIMYGVQVRDTGPGIYSKPVPMTMPEGDPVIGVELCAGELIWVVYASKPGKEAVPLGVLAVRDWPSWKSAYSAAIRYDHFPLVAHPQVVQRVWEDTLQFPGLHMFSLMREECECLELTKQPKKSARAAKKRR